MDRFIDIEAFYRIFRDLSTSVHSCSDMQEVLDLSRYKLHYSPVPVFLEAWVGPLEERVRQVPSGKGAVVGNHGPGSNLGHAEVG